MTQDKSNTLPSPFRLPPQNPKRTNPHDRPLAFPFTIPFLLTLIEHQTILAHTYLTTHNSNDPLTISILLTIPHYPPKSPTFGTTIPNKNQAATLSSRPQAQLPSKPSLPFPPLQSPD